MLEIMCPKCKVKLVEEEHGGVKIDICKNCSGIFFDDKELNRLKNVKGATVSVYETGVGESEKKEETTLTCPTCGNIMDKHKYLDTDIIIDSCPVCFGIWLDAGEFTEIYNYAQKLADSDDVDEELLKLLKEEKKNFEKGMKKSFVGDSNIIFRLFKKLI